MNHFHYRGGALVAEGVPLARIAERVGTPTYVYSTATLTRHLQVLTRKFAAQPHLLCYSVKANSNLSILRLVAKLGAGFDIVSEGELERVLRAGGDPRKLVFSGVGKTDAEMARALRAGILMFNVESAEELEALDRIGTRMKRRAPFAIRVNPDVDARTHRHIATGLKTSKFGVPLDQAAALYERSRALRGVIARGVDCHIGSQLTDLFPLKVAVAKMVELFRVLKERGHPMEYIDVGGGLGVRYSNEVPPTPSDYAAAIQRGIRGSGATVILEPGRVIAANAGVLLARVVYRKTTSFKSFVVLDAGMNDLIRPALYDAFHSLLPVQKRTGRAQLLDFVGPVCESSDVLARDRKLVFPRIGELYAFMGAGAYGMSMASNYNSRPRPAEVLVQGARFRVIRERETFADLIRGES
jgi:diaminopimelate decarboxylase